MEFYNTTNSNQIEGFSDIITKYIGNINDGYVIDVGAHDGYTWSNAWPLITAGWSALLIEPHPNFVNKINTVYKGNDKVTVLQMAVSNKTGETVLFECSGQGALSTIKKEMLEGYKTVSWAANAGKVTGNKFTVKMDTLDNILEETSAPIGFDVLTLDCEGSEEDVLNGFSIDKWKPKMVIVETLEVRDANERAKLDMKGGMFYKYCDELFDSHGYDKVFVDAINSVYVRRNE